MKLMENFLITTERLALVPIQESDIDEIYAALLETPQITKMLTFDPPTCREDTENFVKWTLSRMPEKDVIWVVRLDGRFIGLVGINDIECKVLAWQIDNGNIGYWFVPDVAGKGIATEAVSAVLDEGFSRLNLHKISGRVVVGNGASERILKKLGFEEIGIQKEHFFRYGKWWDCMWLEKLNTIIKQ